MVAGSCSAASIPQEQAPKVIVAGLNLRSFLRPLVGCGYRLLALPVTTV
jgi:hypothetical protein